MSDDKDLSHLALVAAFASPSQFNRPELEQLLIEFEQTKSRYDHRMQQNEKVLKIASKQLKDMDLPDLKKTLDSDIHELHDINEHNKKEISGYVDCLARKMEKQSLQDTLNKNDRNKIAAQKIEINTLNQEISKLDKEKSKLLAEYKQADDDKALQATLEKYRVEHELYKLMLDTKEFVE